jgi:hypothetical protein
VFTDVKGTISAIQYSPIIRRSSPTWAGSRGTCIPVVQAILEAGNGAGFPGISRCGRPAENSRIGRPERLETAGVSAHQPADIVRPIAPCELMHIHLAPQSIEALATIISGGGGNDQTPPIGIYRSASRLESFMRGCNVAMSVGGGSRLPTLVEALERANRGGDQTILKNIIERAADPRDFISDPDRLQSVIDYLNARLAYDGVELQRVGQQVRLGSPGKSSSVVGALATAVVTIDFDTVKRDLERALASAESDPEDAVTSACSVVESVCRSVLIELGSPLPSKKDIQGLYQAVREPLGLTPDKDGVADDIANDVRTILGGLNSVVNGVGALRTHGGDAHGRERGYRRIDPRIARLAIHSASTVSLFLVETWQKKFPSRQLKSH